LIFALTATKHLLFAIPKDLLLNNFWPFTS